MTKSSPLRKHFFLLLFAAINCITVAVAQTPMYAKNGSGTTGNTIPLNQASQKTQLLYAPSDFGTTPISGNITKIYFRNSAAGAVGAYTSFQIRMMQTGDLAFPSTSYYTTGFTVVHSAASQTVTANATAGGWFEIILNSPYAYNNSQSLVVEIQYASMTTGISTTTSVSTGRNTRCSGQVLTATTGTASTTQNDFGMDISAGVCTSPPTPGTATVAPASFVCTGTTVTLNLTGNTTGGGQTYQWQKSVTLGGTYTDVGPSSNFSNFNATVTQDSFYRCAVTCASSTTFSTPVSVTVNPGLAAGTYTINSALVTGGTNFQTFAAALNAMTCGIQGPIVFNVDAASGPYTEQIIIPQINNTSATNTITFNGNGRTIQFTPVSANRHIIRLDGADYITLKNLHIVGLATDYDWGIQLTNGANYDSIVNCTINMSANTSTTQSNSAGIVASGSNTTVTTAGNSTNNLVVQGCFISGAYQGIILNGASVTARITNNQILNNTIQDFYANGIELTNNDSVVVAGNNIHRTTRTAVTTFAGVELGAGNKRARLYNNKIHSTHTAAATLTGAAYGIYANGCDAPLDSANLVYNNVIYNFNSGSGTIYALYNSSSDGVHYYHNTVNLDYSAATAGVTRGFYQTTLASDIVFRNNNISITRAGTGIKYCVYLNTATSTITSDNNNLYINSPTSSSAGVGYYSIGYPTLADWKLANSNAYDQFSKSVAPAFANIAAGDFTATAPLLNDFVTAVPQVPTDILGVTRGTNTDAGAYEYIPGPCSTPIGGTATSSVVLPACAGNLFTLNLVGNSINTGQTYQWESSSTIGGTYTPISGQLTAAAFQTSSTTNKFYRCVVTCASTTSTSTSSSVEVQVNGLMAAGTYTINSALPLGSGNFPTFAEAVNALNCGTTGSVIFSIANGTYSERFDVSVWLTNASDSIVFKSAGANSALVTITSPSGTAAILNSVVSIQKSRNIIFRDLTFTRSGTAANSSVIEMDSTRGVQFYNNIFVGPTFTATNTTGTQSHIFSTDANTEDSTVIIGNTFTNNSNGLWFFSNIDKPSRKTIVQGNTFNNSYLSIFLKHHNAISITNNTIQRNAAGTFDYYGMSLENCDSSATITRNTIYYNRGYGIRLLGSDGRVGYPNRIFNNMIGADQGTGTALSYGISIESNSTYNTAYTDIMHNTVMVNGASTTAGRTISSAGVAASQANNIRILNNILVNNGLGYVYYFPANALSTNNTIDRNNAYTAGVNIATWNSTTGIPLKPQAAWVSASGMDSFSSFVPVTFVSATNLHLASGSTTDFNLATNITSLITTDFDGTARTGTYFVKGAHEASVLTAPAVADAGVWTIESIPAVTATTTYNVNVKIRNNGFVPLTSADIKYALNGTFAGSFSYTGTLAPGATTNILAGTISLPTGTNTVSAWTENTNGTASDLNKNNDTVHVGTITSPPLSGTYTVGPTLDFANLTAVSNALRTKLISGNVTFHIDQTYTSTTETFPIRFSSPTVSTFPVTIMPAPTATAILTVGTPASAAQLIVLDSTMGMTFDGRAGGTGTTPIWTIRNTQTASTYGAVFQFLNGAQYDTLQYLKLESQSTNTTNGVVQFSTSTQAFGNSHNTIRNCIISDRTDVTAAGPYNAIYSAGTDVSKNVHNTISDNTISNFTNNGINVAATGNGDNWIISGNQFYYNSANLPVATAAQTAINFIPADGSSGHTISSNTIGGSSVNAGGTAWSNSGANLFAGIIVTVDSMSKTTVSGNTVSNISKTGTGAASFAGIRIIRGRIEVSNNTIGHPTTANSVTNSGTSFMYGIELQNTLGTSDTVSVTGNTVANITSTGINANDRVRGISFGFTASVTPLLIMNGNTVHHLKTMGTATGYAVDLATITGILVFPSTYKPGSRISNNIVYDIDAAKDTALATMSLGIAASNFSGSIFNNTIYNITNKSIAPAGVNTAVAAGLYTRFLSSCEVYNNMISLSDNNHSSSAQLNGILIAGSGGGTHQYYYNSVNIESTSGLLQSSFAFHRGQNNVAAASAHPINLRNNIFKNTSSGTVGGHYAMGIEDTAVIVAGVSNYNVLKTSDTTKLNLWGTSTYNLSNWRSITTNDVNSKATDVSFVNPATADLHVTGGSIGNLLLSGITIATISKDFDGETRNSVPYIGADENVANPLPVTLVSFAARKQQMNVELNWATAGEYNASHYEIERSTDGVSFAQVSMVKANGTTGKLIRYQYTDAEILMKQDPTLYYRLKMVDNDGQFEYSKTVLISNTDENMNQSEMVVYPNPFTNEVTVSFESSNASDLKLEVADITGKIIATYHKPGMEGNNLITLSELSGLKAGLYFISISNGEHTQSSKLMKQ
ncbi:MAG: T9SS type A sorting domain-containing protein [Bacteroidota bacterium]